MEKTSIHFNEKGFQRKTTLDTKNNFSNPKQDADHIERVFREEKGDINFEAPCDDEDEEEVTSERSQDDRLVDLEKRQLVMMTMLQQLLDKFPKYKGYITMADAIRQFNVTDREIHRKISLFQRVHSRKIEVRKLNKERYFKEVDLVEAMLLDIEMVREHQLKLLKSSVEESYN